MRSRLNLPPNKVELLKFNFLQKKYPRLEHGFYSLPLLPTTPFFVCLFVKNNILHRNRVRKDSTITSFSKTVSFHHCSFPESPWNRYGKNEDFFPRLVLLFLIQGSKVNWLFCLVNIFANILDPVCLLEWFIWVFLELKSTQQSSTNPLISERMMKLFMKSWPLNLLFTFF